MLTMLPSQNLHDCLLPATGGEVSPWLIVVGVGVLLAGGATVAASRRSRRASLAAMSLIVLGVLAVGGTAGSGSAHAVTPPCATTPATTAAPSETPAPAAPSPTPPTPTPTPDPSVDLAIALEMDHDATTPGESRPRTGQVRVENLSSDTASGPDVTFRVTRVDEASAWTLIEGDGWNIDAASDPHAIVFTHAGPLAPGATTTVTFGFTFYRETFAAVLFTASLDEGTGDDDDPSNNVATDFCIMAIAPD